MNDDPGVLGRLPRSRPGTRSEKRVADAPARAAESSEQRVTKASKPAKAKAKAAAGPKAAARPKAAATPKPAARPKAAAGPKPPSQPKAAPPPKPARPPKAGRPARPAHTAPPEPRQPDTLTDAVRAGVRVAEGGIKLAGGITRELLRRLPRP